MQELSELLPVALNKSFSFWKYFYYNFIRSFSHSSFGWCRKKAKHFFLCSWKLIFDVRSLMMHVEDALVDRKVSLVSVFFFFIFFKCYAQSIFSARERWLISGLLLLKSCLIHCFQNCSRYLVHVALTRWSMLHHHYLPHFEHFNVNWANEF